MSASVTRTPSPLKELPDPGPTHADMQRFQHYAGFLLRNLSEGLPRYELIQKIELALLQCYSKDRVNLGPDSGPVRPYKKPRKTLDHVAAARMRALDCISLGGFTPATANKVIEIFREGVARAAQQRILPK